MGGSAHEWIGTLPADLEPGGSLLVDLTMTKFQAPDVVIGYEIRVEGAGSLFADGFESGDTSAWSATAPSSPSAPPTRTSCRGHS